MSSAWLWLAAALAVCSVEAQNGPSLRGALEALQRRQRAHSIPPFEETVDYDLLDVVPLDVLNNLDYQAPMLNKNNVAVSNWVDAYANQNQANNFKKEHKPSPFRERSYQSENGQLKDLFDGKQPEEEYNNADSDNKYAAVLALWPKNNNEVPYIPTPLGPVQIFDGKSEYKRNANNWGLIAYKKNQGSSLNPASHISYNYESDIEPEDEEDEEKVIEKIEGDDSDSLPEPKNNSAINLSDSDIKEMDNAIRMFSLKHGIITEKPVTISKRSSGNYHVKSFAQNNNEALKSFKSSSGTDPKTLKDLSKIFGDPKDFVIRRQVRRVKKTPLKIRTKNKKRLHFIISEAEKQDNEKPIVVTKKSIDWSQYFGIDKRNEKSPDSTQNQLLKQYFDSFSREVIYPANIKSQKVKRDNLPAISKQYIDPKEADQDKKKITKRSKDIEEKLDNTEDQEMKQKLLTHLANAYSTEKMRKALNEFKESLKQQKIDGKVNTEAPKLESKVKRVAEKKENVDDFETEQGAGHYSNGRGDDEFYEQQRTDGSGRRQEPTVAAVPTSGTCPVLSKIQTTCEGIDIVAGTRGQIFIPLCTLYQLCHICIAGAEPRCEFMFLADVDSLCKKDINCRRIARSVLNTIRNLDDEELADELDGDCEASPCLLEALKQNPKWRHGLFGEKSKQDTTRYY